jgi:hypothetical protein
MVFRRPNNLRRLLAPLAARPQGLMAVLLALVIPGAVALCVAHCALGAAAPAHAHHHGDDSSMGWVCHLTTHDGLEQPVGGALLYGPTQGLVGRADGLSGGLIFLCLAVVATALVGARLIEAPPVPPPRPR